MKVVSAFSSISWQKRKQVYFPKCLTIVLITVTSMWVKCWNKRKLNSLSCFPYTVDIRETAFVYAITAAGVAHAVTQACSMGDLLQCGCEATRNRAPPRPSPTSSSGDGVKWEWGGCGDDVEFGYEKSKQFMDAKRRRGKSDIRTLIDLHNNEAGRLVRNSFRINNWVCLCGFCLHFEWVELETNAMHCYCTVLNTGLRFHCTF